MRTPSIVQTKRVCACCGKQNWLEIHHIFFGNSNRKWSDADGLWCWLCAEHHRDEPNGVHGGNKELDKELKEIAQYKWMTFYKKDTKDFIKRYGKAYFDDEGEPISPKVAEYLDWGE